MPRLTRTQKYAGLREQLSNDSEASNKNQALNNYEERIRELENVLMNQGKPVIEEITEEPVKEEIETVIEKTVEDKPAETVKEENPVFEEEKEESVFEFLSNLDADNIDKAVNDILGTEIDIFDEPRKEEIKLADFEDIFASIDAEIENIANVSEEAEEIADIDEAPLNEITGEEEVEVITEPEKPVILKEAPVKEEVTLNYVDQDYSAIAKVLAGEVETLNGKVEPVKEETKTVPAVKLVVHEEKIEEVINEVSAIIDELIEEEPIEEKPEETVTIEESKETVNSEKEVNEYINETLKEALDYTKEDGLKTITDISNDMIDTIRHRDEGNKLANEDDVFSNTVSLEIDKVLSEIKEDAPSAISESIQETKIINTINEVAHPVLTKALEEEVEIKSMEETFSQPIISNTLAYENDEEDEEDDDYEYDDDSTPNKILNVILVILIVILAAILGVLAYYMLYAKGIIG